mgnify:CR=1 FL=1
MPAQRGFTLLELLVVIAIAGLMTGLAVASLDSGKAPLQQALERLAAAARAQAELAVHGGQVRGLRWNGQRPEFVQLGEGGQWRVAQVALGELAARLIAAHAPAAYESGHELSLLQPDGPVCVQAQPMLLELALRNLIANALRHTPPGTQVAVEVWQDARACGVSVSDDGQRAGAAAVDAAATHGLGLGLRLVERMAEQIQIARRPARIRIRYLAGITPDMRVIIAGRVYQIIAGPSMLGRREAIELMVEEHSSEGTAP